MIKQLLVALLLFAAVKTNASDSLVVSIDKNRLFKGDTLGIDVALPFYKEEHLQAATLHVWIEDVAKMRRWKFRYPVLNGTVSANLVIGDNLPDGKYAINFMIQRKLFSLTGKIKDYNPKQKSLIMLMLAKKQKTFIDNVTVNPDGSFLVKNLVFEDTARFVFSSVGKKGTNDLYINATTPLDSSFTPLYTTTQFVMIGDPAKMVSADTLVKYHLDTTSFTAPVTIPDVIVKGVRKKKVELFDEEFATGLFQGGDAVIFDGIDDPTLASSIDVFSFLRGRIAGLMITNSDEGGYDITWRGQKIDVYLDEFKIDSDDPLYIMPSDVAMIKVFRPPSGPSGRGSIAIYTKRGAYVTDPSRKYIFLVHGYTPVESIWN